MNYNFTGAVTQRRINLGSAHEISSAELAQQAREERAIRSEIRQRHAAATKIQSASRGRRAHEVQRQALRQRFQELGGSDFEKATMIVSLATRRSAIFKRLERAGISARLSRAEIKALDEDDVLLKSWAAEALSSHTSSECLSLLSARSHCAVMLTKWA